MRIDCPESILNHYSKSEYAQDTYTQYLAKWHNLPVPAGIQMQIKRIRLKVDLSNPDNYNHSSREYWEENSQLNSPSPDGTFNSCSNNLPQYDLRYIRIGYSLDKSKPMISINCGMHGRHEASNRQFIYEYIKTLFENIDELWVQYLLHNYQFLIFPCVNVYGNFSSTKDSNCNLSYLNKNNVDLLLNWDPGKDGWWEALLDDYSNNPICGRNLQPFSEPESMIIRNVNESLVMQGHSFVLHIDFHNNGTTGVVWEAAYQARGLNEYNNIVPSWASSWYDKYYEWISLTITRLYNLWPSYDSYPPLGSTSEKVWRVLETSIDQDTPCSSENPIIISVSDNTWCFYADEQGEQNYVSIDNECFKYDWSDVNYPFGNTTQLKLIGRAEKGSIATSHQEGIPVVWYGMTHHSEGAIVPSRYETSYFAEKFKAISIIIEPTKWWRKHEPGWTTTGIETETEIMYSIFMITLSTMIDVSCEIADLKLVRKRALSKCNMDNYSFIG